MLIESSSSTCVRTDRHALHLLCSAKGVVDKSVRWHPRACRTRSVSLRSIISER